MPNAGAYLVSCEAGNAGMPGAPILHFSLVVAAATGKVSGHATITQAIAPPYGVKQISDVTGQIYSTGLGEYTKVVGLKGTYYEPFPPPAIGAMAVPFEAHFAVNNAWNGRGGFSCGTLMVENVPVKKISPHLPPPTIMLYGAAVQEATACGDLSKMKIVCQQAEEYLKNTGEVSAALQKLNAEIAKLEKQ